MAGRKDELDELMLKGVKKAGHCDWFGVVRVPAYLKHVGEEGVEVEFVGFVPPSVALGMRGSKSGGDDDGRRRKLEPMGMCGFLGVVMDGSGEVSNMSFTQSITNQPSTSDTNAAALHEYVKKQEKFRSGSVSPQRCHQEGAESNGAAHHPICPTTRLDH
ncbi:hypothetical protein BCR33DRAFT_747760 [Rhizoclosmatium globosum]|uniref:Uncharacterized protein n=1 Tax=Rhizoclosmatium globosum TaxID=329046 RepID=A0A1Y2ARQ5_9FUNG|nr:hypothetical protein BCR33DRAFT_747760 [Rhizoclosmatium globosum]|eukprot:ORY24645.1 hypothetical protein BCR33DRAFT_747760 [Rhizoclosmatium globosum]